MTRRRASCSRTLSSSVILRADSRQASLKSSKRSEPSTSTSASLAIEVAVLLEGVLEQHCLDAPGAVIEGEDHARPALLHLIDQARHGHRLARRRSARLEAGGRAGRSPGPRSGATRSASGPDSKRPSGLAGEIEPEGLALAAQAHRLAPLRHGSRRRRRPAARATGRRSSPNMSFCPASSPRVLVAELHGAGKRSMSVARLRQGHETAACAAAPRAPAGWPSPDPAAGTGPRGEAIRPARGALADERLDRRPPPPRVTAPRP